MNTAVAQDLAVSLSISLVCYRSDPQRLLCTLNSLHAAVNHASARLPLITTLTVIDNGNETDLLQPLLQRSGLAAELISNEHNAGFGKANNQAIDNAASDFHLVLNPDVELQDDALLVAINYLQQTPQAVAISPACRNGSGEIEHLCKRYPSLWILFLRGFAPRWLKNRFEPSLARYEYQELTTCTGAAKVELISGCFMLCRTSALQQAGGFDEDYFLYFEDFALSIELSRIGELHYLPACRIVHHGGNASRKGLQHIRHFLKSAWHFFRSYGWKAR